jgi:hypothetical protein
MPADDLLFLGIVVGVSGGVKAPRSRSFRSANSMDRSCDPGDAGGELHVRLCVGLLGTQRFFQADLLCGTCTTGFGFERSRLGVTDEGENIRDIFVFKPSDCRWQVLLILLLLEI